ncbi:FAD-binding domain-containing protein [Athelia psychrophila]|uniref:FAD-binding domain-containing protein n=1 Tax=Athelia psychrophila TaxID=1759441 RepID=A0A166P3D3_9AGAM|nr:FAD-binding domain-containing protein [Fibularhizoctonia sp. CBS 109695]
MLSPLFVCVLSLAAGAHAATKRCYPGDSCFPGASALAAFNTSIGSKLHAHIPIGAACYPSDPLYNATECELITANYQVDQWRTDMFSSYEQINWETCGVESSCLVPPNNKSATCGQGSVPNYAVHATTVSDVQQYVKFATKYNLRIVIKNTGHDYSGRSSGRGGFALWTHGMQGVSRNQTFVPALCSTTPQDSLTLGAGVQWETAYNYADAQDFLIIGGDVNQVGAAGGWLLGGGHSVLSPSYGLGVDNLLEAHVVTADGQMRVVSECSNADLFWAIRGGGAGTWGVTTQVTYKVHPNVPINAVFLAMNFTGPEQTYDLVGNLSAIAPALMDLGIGGELIIRPTWLNYFAVLPGSNLSVLQSAVKPVTDLLPNGTATFATFATYRAFFNVTYGVSNEIVGIPFALTSRLIPRHYFSGDPRGVAQALRDGQVASGAEMDSQAIQVLIDLPAPSFNLGKTSVTPAWYDSLWHVLYTGTWNASTSVADQRAEISSLHNAGNVLRAFAPDGGAYSNEADIYDRDVRPNHEESFWGENAARLRSIKKDVDPDSVFQVWQGIGWDGADDQKYACYAELDPGSINLE